MATEQQSVNRILIVHNRYREQGGEDVVYAAEASMLARYGHEVRQLEFSNDEIDDQRSGVESFRLAVDTIWSRSAAVRIRTAVREMRAEVVHFHNTFPLVSPSAYGAARAEGATIVQTIHNYRLLCANALFFRDGRPCEDCVGKTPPWPGIVHSCYRDSRSQTAVTAAMLTAHRIRGTWRRDVDSYIALTEFSRRKLLLAGIPENRIAVKPNFLLDDPGIGHSDGDYVLFVGRLTIDKGIETLLQAAQRTPFALRIAGVGPLTPQVEAAAADTPGITYLGRLSQEEVFRQMHSARALIFPSVWYETFGMTIVEAFACGLPVIASRLGTMAEIIEDNETGLFFEAGNAEDLVAKIRWIGNHPGEARRMGQRARQVFIERFTLDRNYHRLMEIYALARVSNAGG